MSQESYTDRLRRHSSESRLDPLRDAVRHALAMWDQEDEPARIELSDEFWASMRNLRMVLLEVSRGGEEDEVPEVEVTDTRSSSSNLVDSPERPVEGRRSGAKNVSAPVYQEAFISEARRSMGQPTRKEAESYLGRYVMLTFNAETARGTQARGILTQVTDHSAPIQRSLSGAGQGIRPVYLMLDDDKNLTYPLNSIQSITLVP